MEAHPPSYGQAVAVNAWDLVAGYISSSDLCSAALVCQAWHTTFAPHLWGNPASHFGNENDKVYVALTRFKRTLPWARLSVRSLTHTLRLPPAHAEIYNGPHSDWLREVLEGLPNLQSLVVRGLPFFDHAALDALKYTRPPGNRSGYQLIPAHKPFYLRLLDASRCGNVTASGLQQALSRFDSLIYLDLSWTCSAKDPGVLKTLGRFSGLQVLKLRGISLRDEDVQILASAIKTRVRSLDVRNNQLTDRSVRLLLHHCFTLPQRNSDGQVSSPSLQPYVGAEMLSIYRGHQFEAYLRNEFSSKFVGRLAIEDAPESGITHLYISNNHLTVEGLSGLIRSGRLHVLDAGSLEHGPSIHSSLGYERDMTFPREEKLIPVPAESGSHSLTYLRINHSLVTKEQLNPTEEYVVSGRVELPAPSATPPNTFELDASTEIYELPGDTSFRPELAGDPIHIVVSSSDERNKPSMALGPQHQPVEPRRGSIDLPIPLHVAAPEDCSLHVASIEEADDTSRAATNRTLSPTASASFRGRERSYSSIAGERKTRVQSHLAQAKGFHPGVLPHLTTLVLTDVPSVAPDTKPSDRLVAFVRECAEEASLARLQARLDWTMPPGRHSSANHRQDQIRKTFALEQVVLEVAPEKPYGNDNSNAASAWRHRGTKAITQDQDSEALWTAAETDFSFFGEGEVCSLQSSLEPQRPPLAIMSGMELSVAEPGPRQPIRPKQPMARSDSGASGPRIDVISEIARFRASKKSTYQACLAAGEEEPEIEGYWEGNIKVVRRPHDVDPKHEDDEVWADYYGNQFSIGYLYR